MATVARMNEIYRRKLVVSSAEEFRQGALEFIGEFKKFRSGPGAVDDTARTQASHLLLQYVLARSADDQLTRKEVAQRHVAALAAVLMASASPKVEASALCCLQVLLHVYPAACGAVLTRMEQYALERFASGRPEVRRQAAVLYVQCVSRVDKVGPPDTHRFNMLLRTTHDALVALHLGHQSERCRLSGSLSTVSCVVSLDGRSKLSLLNIVSASLESVRQILVIGACPSVRIPLADIVDCFECVSSSIIGMNTVDSVEIVAVRQVLEDLCGMLFTVIGCLKQLFSPYCSRMTSTFLKLVKQCSKSHCPLMVKTAVRRLVYDGLSTMLKHSGAASNLHLKSKSLMFLLQEEMSTCAFLVHHGLADGKNNDRQALVVGDRRGTLYSFLQTLTAFVSNVGSLLPAEAYQMLQLFAIRTLPRCQALMSPNNGSLCTIAAEVKRQLTELLGAFLLNPHAKAPYYLNASIALFRWSCHHAHADSTTEICKNYLSICERIVNPIVPCIQSSAPMEAIDAIRVDRDSAEVEVLTDHLGGSFTIGTRRPIDHQADDAEAMKLQQKKKMRMMAQSEPEECTGKLSLVAACSEHSAEVDDSQDYADESLSPISCCSGGNQDRSDDLVEDSDTSGFDIDISASLL